MNTAAARAATPEPRPLSEPPAAQEPARHLPALDGLRGAAILLVLLHNLNVLTPPWSAPAHAVGLLMDLGWVGVQLFFVLSGFLITGILVDSRDRPGYYRRFYGRRTVRIFPLYYAVLLVTFALVPVLITHRPVAGHEHQIWLWTYLANWAEPFDRTVSLFPHFWSLAIEEQFYLAWPLLVRVLAPRHLWRACLALALVALASRIAVRATDLGAAGAYMFTICRVDALVLGGAGALLVRTPSSMAWIDRHRALVRWGAIGLLAVTVVITRGAPRTGVLTQTFGYTLLAIAFAALVVDAATARDGWWRRLLELSPLRAAGRYSYAMYVFHTPLHLLVGLPLLARLSSGTVSLPVALAYLVAATLVTSLAAVLSYHLLEKHFLRLKHLFDR